MNIPFFVHLFCVDWKFFSRYHLYFKYFEAKTILICIFFIEIFQVSQFKKVGRLKQCTFLIQWKLYDTIRMCQQIRLISHKRKSSFANEELHWEFLTMCLYGCILPFFKVDLLILNFPLLCKALVFNFEKIIFLKILWLFRLFVN